MERGSGGPDPMLVSSIIILSVAVRKDYTAVPLSCYKY
jgi:hypothetical protein